MPFSPRQYPLVQAPQIDPMRSLADVMYAARGFQALDAEHKEQQRTKRVEDALNAAKGDPVGAATLLEQGGDFVSGRSLRERATEIHQTNRAQALDRIGQQATIFGKAEQALREVEARPELYGEVRPRLMDLAAQVDPRLAQEIPEQYDPERVTGMMQFVQQGAVESSRTAEALKRLDALGKASADRTKLVDDQRGILQEYLDKGPGTPEYRDGVLTFGRSIGLLPEVVDSFANWTPKKDEATRPTTIQAALLDPNLTPERKKELLALQTALSAAQRDPDAAVDPMAVQAIMRTPHLWRAINPELRGRLMVPLEKAGFDFPAAIEGLSESEIERLRVSDIRQLDRERRRRDSVTGEPTMSDAQYREERERIEGFYRALRGDTAPRPAQTDRGRPPANATSPFVPPQTTRTEAPATAALPGDLHGPVSELLKDEPAGRYEINNGDGGVWEKAADGTIKRVQ